MHCLMQTLLMHFRATIPHLAISCGKWAGLSTAILRSFKTLKMDWSCSGAPELAATVAGIRTWYGSLDDEFEAVIHGYSEADLQNRTINRGHWSSSAMVQFHIFREAVLMFLAKASVYLKAMRKHLSDEWRAAIG